MSKLSQLFIIEFQIDDPVGVIPVHFIAGCFGMLSAGIFARIDEFNVSEFAKIFEIVCL